MQVKLRTYTLGLAFTLLGCHAPSANNDMPDMAQMPQMDAGIVGQHGKAVDYFSGMPLAGLTVTDGTASTTTDANGEWVLPAPTGQVLAPVISGTGYVPLHLAYATAGADDMDRGTIVMATTQDFMTEQSLLTFDQTRAVVHIAIFRTGACTSLAGGTLTVNAPSGTSIVYFDKSGLPLGSQLIDAAADKPSALLYNVAPGANLDFTLTHPTCTLAPAGSVTYNGVTFTGQTPTMAAEPGDNTSALVLIAQ
jgi:hypothetical protein